MRVLIAEDNPENLDMLTRRLERRGFAVFAARDGQVAIDQTLELRPDVILMDVSMPVLSGLRGDPRDPAAAGRRRHPDHRADRPRDGRRSRALPGSRVRRLRDKTGGPAEPHRDDGTSRADAGRLIEAIRLQSAGRRS